MFPNYIPRYSLYKLFTDAKVVHSLQMPPNAVSLSHNSFLTLTMLLTAFYPTRPLAMMHHSQRQPSIIANLLLLCSNHWQSMTLLLELKPELLNNAKMNKQNKISSMISGQLLNPSASHKYVTIYKPLNDTCNNSITHSLTQH
jgi:hypothetical protein